MEALARTSGPGFLILTLALWAVAAERASLLDAAVVLALLPVSWALADFITGIVHWALDHYGDPELPIIGPHFIVPFREHHALPKKILEKDDLDTIGTSAMPAIIAQTGLLGILIAGAPVWIVVALSVTIVGTVLTNLFHQWAHDPEPHRLAQWMQHERLVLGADEHARHHEAPYDAAYCITCGWLNPALERVKFFERFESALASIGIHPHPSSGH